MSQINRRTFESSTLRGLPILAIGEGRILGKVKEEVYDPKTHTLLGVIVSPANGGSESFLDRLRVRRLGPFAVTVVNSDDLQELREHERAQEVVVSNIRLRGAPVITDIGEQIGRIDQIWIDDSGAVLKYRSSNGGFGFGQRHDIAPKDISVVGEDAVIVPPSVFDRGAGEDARQQGASSSNENASHTTGI
jgi:sporulation protein YlmC with PRC-barrel domain